jgi:hypothetical protein
MRRVKGVLFADYVRMIRAAKGLDWASRLGAEDLAYVDETIDPAGWYPMEVFERMGNAILALVAKNQLALVRVWGRLSADDLRAKEPLLVAAGDPVETLRRFRVLRSTYFDFEALSLTELFDDQAQVEIAYHMGMPAEEAAAIQTLGFFERLLEASGARNVQARFASRCWTGDERTLLDLKWTGPAGG